MVDSHHQPDGTRFKNCLYDITSYLPETIVERDEASCVMDGLFSAGGMQVEIRNKPKYADPEHDTYYYYDPEDLIKHPSNWSC